MFMLNHLNIRVDLDIIFFFKTSWQLKIYRHLRMDFFKRDRLAEKFKVRLES